MATKNILDVGEKKAPDAPVLGVGRWSSEVMNSDHDIFLYELWFERFFIKYILKIKAN